jgi:type I restriction enzyme, S subunit
MNLPQGWIETTFDTILNYEQPTAYIVKSTEYNDTYKTAVLTAGKSFIIGYTNEKDGIYSENLPVIIFDDFTTAIQYVTFPFKVKSSAMKILQTINEQFNKKYIYYYMQTIKHNVTTHKRYWISDYSKQNIPLPPFHEQQRIVARIDSLFSELDNGVTLLKTIKAQLAVYKKAVLKWAFEGKLTNNDWEMGVLEDIVSEIKIGPFGTLLHKADYIENGIPIINPKHMNNQKIIYDSHTTISKQKAEDLSSYKLQENDIILARRGEMGRTAPITEKEVGWLCGTGSMIIRLKTGNLNDLYSLFLSSERVRKYLSENCKGTTMDNLNETIVKKIPVPICSKSEQQAIVSAIESRLSVCDKLEQTIDRTLALSVSLRQSILKKAFEGRLVPQDPNDEPAEKLLERIKVEKAAVLARQKQTREWAKNDKT